MNLANLEAVYKLAENLKQLKAIKAIAEDRYTNDATYYVGVTLERTEKVTEAEIPITQFLQFVNERIAAVGGELNALGVKV